MIGGKSLFRPQESELLPSGKELLRQEVAPDLRGFKNRIEVRGHTASGASGPGGMPEDTWFLAYLRAQSVMRYLVDECGIDIRRFRVVSCGDNEPLDSNLDPRGRERNRRVEVIMTEELIKEPGEADRKAR